MNSYRPPESETTAAVATLVHAAYCDIEVDVGESVVLRSPHRSQAELRMIWKAAAWNKASVEARSSDRQALLDLLLS